MAFFEGGWNRPAEIPRPEILQGDNGGEGISPTEKNGDDLGSDTGSSRDGESPKQGGNPDGKEVCSLSEEDVADCPP